MSQADLDSLSDYGWIAAISDLAWIRNEEAQSRGLL